MKPKPLLSPDHPARYRLCLQGRPSADWSDWLPDVHQSFEDGQTILTGTLRDQAALFGLLSFVRDLGAVLLAVEYLPGTNDQKETK